MSARAVFCVFVAFFVVITEGKVFTPQELALVLRAHNVSDWDIPTLVCVAHQISGLDTSSVVSRLREGHRKVRLYGVFGLEEAEDDETYQECNCGLGANRLTDDDVTDDIDCLIGCLADTVVTHHHHHSPSDYLNIYHEVDMKHCFHWWRKLSPILFSEDSERDNPKKHHLTNSHASGTLPDSHSPITGNCKCHCSNTSVIVEISLILLNILVIALCYIVWSVFGHRKFVRSEFVNITDRS